MSQGPDWVEPLVRVEDIHAYIIDESWKAWRAQQPGH